MAARCNQPARGRACAKYALLASWAATSLGLQELAVKRIGLMGCGTVAGYGHLPALRDEPGLELHALYDPNEQHLHAMQKRFGVPHAFTGYRDTIGAIREDRDPMCPGEEGRRAVELILACCESHKRGGATINLPLQV